MQFELQKKWKDAAYRDAKNITGCSWWETQMDRFPTLKIATQYILGWIIAFNCLFNITKRKVIKKTALIRGQP